MSSWSQVAPSYPGVAPWYNSHNMQNVPIHMSVPVQMSDSRQTNGGSCFAGPLSGGMCAILTNSQYSHVNPASWSPAYPPPGQAAWDYQSRRQIHGGYPGARTSEVPYEVRVPGVTGATIRGVYRG